MESNLNELPPQAPAGELDSAGCAPTPLLGMLTLDDPELKRCVLFCAKSPSGRLVWMVGCFLQTTVGIWFRCDFDHGIQIPFRDVPGQIPTAVGWMYLPNVPDVERREQAPLPSDG